MSPPLRSPLALFSSLFSETLYGFCLYIICSIHFILVTHVVPFIESFYTGSTRSRRRTMRSTLCTIYKILYALVLSSLSLNPDIGFCWLLRLLPHGGVTPSVPGGRGKRTGTPMRRSTRANITEANTTDVNNTSAERIHETAVVPTHVLSTHPADRISL